MKKYKTLIIGDIHIAEPYFVELGATFYEILTYDADTVIFLGDVFDKNNPTPQEIKFAFTIFQRFSKKYKEVLIIAGNHDIFKGYLVTNLLKFFNNIRVGGSKITEYNASSGKIYLGHHFVDKSIDNYSISPEPIKAISEDNDYVFLGHQHRFQQLEENAWHLGSIRYVGFGEYEEPLTPKKIALLDDSGVTFKDLNCPYKLLQFTKIDDLTSYIEKNYGKNNLIDNKIRLIYNDFITYKNDINKLDKLPSVIKGNLKVKLVFQENNILNSNTKINMKKLKNTKDIVKKWLSSIKDKDVKTILNEESTILCD